MKLIGQVRQRPDGDATSTADLPWREISAEAEDYDAARGRLVDQVPEGWQLLSIRRASYDNVPAAGDVDDGQGDEDLRGEVARAERDHRGAPNSSSDQVREQYGL